MNPEISVIVPAYHRSSVLQMTLSNLAKALQNITHEVIIVDDASIPPLNSSIDFSDNLNARFLENTDNEGSVYCRHRGILESTGRYIFLTDADDQIDSDKLERHLAKMDVGDHIATYSDQGTRWFDENHAILREEQLRPLSRSCHPVSLFLETDLKSNNVVYQGDLLRKTMLHSIVPVERRFALAGDYWIYFNFVQNQGTVAKIPDTRCWHCMYQDEEQISERWELLGFSGHALCEALATCNENPVQRPDIHEALSRKLFHSYRLLPRDYHPGFYKRQIDLWKSLPRLQSSEYGGHFFQILSTITSPVMAADLMRIIQRPRWKEIATVTPEELDKSFEEYFGDGVNADSFERSPDR